MFDESCWRYLRRNWLALSLQAALVIGLLWGCMIVVTVLAP